MRRVFAFFGRRLLVWFSQTGAFLLTGSPDVTLSALAAYRGDAQGRPGWRRLRRIIDALFWFEHCHCSQALEAEITSEQMPSDMRAYVEAERRRRMLEDSASGPLSRISMARTYGRYGTQAAGLHLGQGEETP
ncbi:hypothetical protein [Neomegalonema sp.]|uniref:hypothetical protein n=1 Tax=Neomegalonema sp. TaxID=2039713 RepID=UPI00261A5AC4|nr:hypothetical protein [Neomegalonema sp.]MDD2870069.1 hypothetical protein [Neomegalonema sp.]